MNPALKLARAIVRDRLRQYLLESYTQPGLIGLLLTPLLHLEQLEASFTVKENTQENKRHLQHRAGTIRITPKFALFAFGFNMCNTGASCRW